MYCQYCGFALSQDALFCQSCGRPQPRPQSPSPPPAIQVPIAGTIQPQQKRKSKVLWLVIGGIVLLVIIVGMLGKSTRQSGAEGIVQKSSAVTESVENVQDMQFSAPSRSQIAPPAYRLYKSGTGAIATYVVPVATSEEQLKSLLWFFRVKVRTGDFKAIGITKPTAEQWGQYGYTSGMLVVYRGTKCANEGYISDAELEKGKIGACGYGEHDDAYYHWESMPIHTKTKQKLRLRMGITLKSLITTITGTRPQRHSNLLVRTQRSHGTQNNKNGNLDNSLQLRWLISSTSEE